MLAWLNEFYRTLHKAIGYESVILEPEASKIELVVWARFDLVAKCCIVHHMGRIEKTITRVSSTCFFDT